MSRMSRTKGKAAELEFCALLREWGFPSAARDWAEKPQVNGDIKGIPDVYCEVRRRETVSIPSWMAEVEEKAGDRLPVLAFRRSRDSWRVCLPADKFFALLRNQREEDDAT